MKKRRKWRHNRGRGRGAWNTRRKRPIGISENRSGIRYPLQAPTAPHPLRDAHSPPAAPTGWPLVHTTPRAHHLHSAGVQCAEKGIPSEGQVVVADERLYLLIG